MTQFTASLSAFTGVARIFRLAGLPLIVVGCLVNGFTPWRSCVAGVLFAFGVAMLVCGLHYRTPFPVQRGATNFVDSDRHTFSLGAGVLAGAGARWATAASTSS